MDDFESKFNDLINRGYDISFYEDENYNLIYPKAGNSILCID